MLIREVLSLYRQIFRVAWHWRVTTAADTEVERLYIQDEARKLFRKNKNVSKDFSKFLLVFWPYDKMWLPSFGVFVKEFWDEVAMTYRFLNCIKEHAYKCTRPKAMPTYLSNRNFNSEITGDLKMFLNSAFLKDFKWKGHFYLWAFCLCPCNLLASTAALVWFVQFHCQISLSMRQNLEDILFPYFLLQDSVPDFGSFWFVLFVAKYFWFDLPQVTQWLETENYSDIADH